MSITNFKKQIWEGALLANFHSLSVADLITSKPVEKDGSKVTFNRVGAGAVKDYAGTIAWDSINTTPVELVFDQKKYFAFSLDDCDKVQLAGDVLKATTLEHAAVLSETVDTYLFAQAVKGVKTTNKIGTTAAQETVNKSNVYDYIVDLGTKLNKAKCPKIDRFCIVNADVLGLLSKDARFTANPVVLENGIVEGQKINGMQVVVSEELPTGNIIALHKSALGYDKQLDEVEAMRLQTSFSDGVRGLCQYGAITLREEAIAVLFYKLA